VLCCEVAVPTDRAFDGPHSGPTIAAVINTLNEEPNIANCIRSLLPWVDDVLVVDMESNDGTVEIARDLGARVTTIPRSTHVEAARAEAIDLLDADWVLVMDADELVPVSLGMRLREIAQTAQADMVDIPFRNFLLGVETTYAGWELEADSHLRFFRQGTVSWGREIHGRPTPLEGARLLKLPRTADMSMIHLAYLDIHHFVSKMDRYTSVEAAQRTGHSKSATRLLVFSAKDFTTRYVRHGGWRGGWRGFSLCVLMMFYEFLIWTKSKEAEAGSDAVTVRRRYDQLARDVADEWQAVAPSDQSLA
jgi:glycosyltransferase involved in cell wall biosynthesis